MGHNCSKQGPAGLVPSGFYFLNIVFENGYYVYNDDKQPIVYSNWHNPCVYLYAFGRDEFLSLPTVAEREVVVVCEMKADAEGSCSEGWIPAGTEKLHCYRKLPNVVASSIYEANKKCADESATLALPSTESELNYLGASVLDEGESMFYNVMMSDTIRYMSNNETITPESYVEYSHLFFYCVIDISEADYTIGWNPTYLWRDCKGTTNYIVCQTDAASV